MITNHCNVSNAKDGSQDAIVLDCVVLGNL